MNEEHEILAERLGRLEAGAPLDAALTGLSGEEANLLRLAVSLRELDAPRLSPSAMAEQRRKVIRAARKGGAMSTNRPASETKTSIFGRRWTLPVAFAGLAGMVVCVALAAVLAGALGFGLGGDRNVARDHERGGTTASGETGGEAAVAAHPGEAVVAAVSGTVEVQAADGTWQAVSAGHKLGQGQRLRTRALSAATLTFFDGSRAELGAGSEVSVEALDAQTAGARVVVLKQWTGESTHDVAHSEHPDSRYQVLTPSGSGTAKGTVFNVVVTPSLYSYFLVDEGAVEVVAVDVTVLVVAGQVTVIPLDQPPSEPVFRISGEGEVVSIGDAWNIGGQEFLTHGQTQIYGAPRVGDWVTMDGRLTLDGQRVADRIILLRPRTSNTFEFQGTVGSIGEGEWVVAGRTVRLDGASVADPDIAVGDLVLVTGGLTADGVFWAARIQSLEGPEPGFQFAGLVEGITAEQWTVAGIAVAVDAETDIEEGLVAGDGALVVGRILDDGTWLAASIARLSSGVATFEFVGTVQDMDPWQVAGITLAVTGTTEIDDDLAVGDLAKVEGVIGVDGTWLANEITRVDQAEQLRFEFIGAVTSINPWIVRGVLLAVDERTEIKGDILVGEMVKVEGWILADGTWLATEIKHTGLHRGQFRGCFAATTAVRGVEASQIVLLNHATLVLSDDVVIVGELQPASVILYTFCLNPDGTLVIIRILFLYQLEVLPVIIVAPTPAPLSGNVVVCHKAGRHNAKTKSIPHSALGGHLGHGDTLGPCP